MFTRDFIFGHHLGTFEIKDQISEKEKQPKKKKKKKTTPQNNKLKPKDCVKALCQTKKEKGGILAKYHYN